MSKTAYLRTGLIIPLIFIFIFPAISEGITTLLSEGFEDSFSGGAPSGWTVAYTTWLFDWVQNAGDYDLMNPVSAHRGSYNAMLYFPNNLEDHQTWLITPAIDFSQDLNDINDINNITATLEFYHLQRQGIAGGQDTLKVYYNKKGPSATTGWVQLASYTSEVGTWTKRKITLPHLSSTYAIGFLGNAKYGYGVCIDDVRVYTSDSNSIPPTKYYAVLCGVSDYQNIDDLHYCDKDARDVCDALLAMGNWKSENITVLTNSDATKTAIQTAISDVANKALDGDIFLFSFSGHGSNDGTNTYLVPYDALEDLPTNDIRDDELGTWIGALPTDGYAVMLDSCFSGGFIKGLSSSGKGVRGKCLIRKGSSNIFQNGDFTTGFSVGYSASRAGTKSVAGKDVQSKDLKTVGRGVVVTACAADEESYETGLLQNGVFTYYLVKGMEGAADTDGDKSISAEESYAYIRPRAAKLTSDPNFSDGPQHSQIYDAWPGELEFGISDPIITKCTVKSKNRPVLKAAGDSISIKGQLGAMASDFQTGSDITVTIEANYMSDPCVLTFPVDGNTFRSSSKFSYSKTVNGVRKSFKYNTKSHIFSFSASKINLTGLSCPLTVSIDIGDYSATAQTDETVVNGKKPMPINLLMGVTDTPRVDKIAVKQNTTKLDSDTLTVKGGFSALDADANMVITDVNIILGTQTWMIPQGSFKAKKLKFSCSKIAIDNQSGIAAASFDFGTGAFTLSIKNADINDVHGLTNFGVNFADVNTTTDVNLP